MDESRSILIPALIGGAVMAVLSWLPLINLGNCLCCMWLLFGGGVGAYMYGRQFPSGTPLSQGDGAKAGFLSGIFGALFFSLLTYFMIAVTGSNPGQGLIETALNSAEEIPVEFEELLNSLQEGSYSPFLVFIGLLFNLVIDAVFGLLGGVLAAALFFRRRPTQSSGPHN